MLLGQRFDAAMLMASEVHGRQCRKGTAIPYISHLLGVAAIALEHGATEDQAIAALLHDAIEDGGGDDARFAIQVRFGRRVEEMVAACSDSFGGDFKPPWVKRKCAYLEHLQHIPSDALLVSAADKLHNLQAILADLRDPSVGKAVFDRFKGGREGTLWYYASLVVAFDTRGQLPASLMRALHAALAELEAQAGYAPPPYPSIPELPHAALVSESGWTDCQSLDEVL